MMNGHSTWRRSVAKYALALGLGAMGAALSTQAVAGCGMYDGPNTPPARWNDAGRGDPGRGDPGRGGDDGGGLRFPGIVGLWKFTFISDGTAYPATIPNGAIIDFGTQMWHGDQTEITVSGGRAPSSGDVCMGVWQQTGASTYKMKHIALAWASGDSNPPVVPPAFVGPGILRENVTLNRARNAFEGTFTIDQYAKDELTLIQHVAGKVVATRFSVD